jgi:hypothetical protein
MRVKVVIWAAYHGYFNMVERILLHPKVNVCTSTKTLLACIAGAKGGVGVVQLLLTHPAGVNSSDIVNEAFKSAVCAGRVEVVKMLMYHPKVDPCANNNFAIRCASNNGRSEVVKLLLQHPNVDPSALDNEAIQ